MTTESATIVQRLWNYCNVLRDESLEGTANLPDPDVLAAEIVEDLEATRAVPVDCGGFRIGQSLYGTQ